MHMCVCMHMYVCVYTLIHTYLNTYIEALIYFNSELLNKPQWLNLYISINHCFTHYAYYNSWDNTNLICPYLC